MTFNFKGTIRNHLTFNTDHKKVLHVQQHVQQHLACLSHMQSKDGQVKHSLLDQAKSRTLH